MTENYNSKNMINSIAHVQSSNIDQISAQGEAIIEQTRKERHNWITRRLDPKQQELQRGEKELIRISQEARNERLKMAKETQLQALKEYCNQYLSQGKAKVRAETARFLIEQAQQLLEEADQIADKFIDRIERKSQRLESVKVDRLRRRAEDQLNKEMDDFYELQNQLMAKYRSIVSEGV